MIVSRLFFWRVNSIIDLISEPGRSTLPNLVLTSAAQLPVTPEVELFADAVCGPVCVGLFTAFHAQLTPPIDWQIPKLFPSCLDNTTYKQHIRLLTIACSPTTDYAIDASIRVLTSYISSSGIPYSVFLTILLDVVISYRVANMGSSKEKKRKRGEEGTAPPKKKVAIQTPGPIVPDTVKVTSVKVYDQCPPVIGKPILNWSYTLSSAHGFSNTSRHMPSRLSQVSGLYETCAIRVEAKTKQACYTIVESAPSFLFT